jgi:hypothetical protein
MGLKTRFMHKQTPAAMPLMPVDIQSLEEFEPAVETKLRKRDDDTASIGSCASDISPIPRQPEGGNFIFDTNKTFLSTFCCHGGSLPGDDDADDIQEKDDVPSQMKETEEDEGLFSKLTGTFLYIIGQAPPVQFVRCLEDRSVDQSEVSLPQVLTDMADEFDQTQRKLEEQHTQLKEQYEIQQKAPASVSRRKLLPKLSLRGSKGSTQRSTGATVSSNSSFFEKMKKSSSSKQEALSPMYEV